MTLTLTSDINATVERMTVTGTVSASIIAGAYRFRLSSSDEIMDLVAFAPVNPERPWPVDRNVWIIHRHMIGTTATTHTNGATVEAVVDDFVASDDDVAPYPVETDGPGVTRTLAQVLAQGNDTGGTAIVSDATGATNAVADITVSSVDGSAGADRLVQASGTGAANAATTVAAGAGQAGASTNATADGGDAYADAIVTSGSGTTASAIRSASIVSGAGVAYVDSYAFADAGTATAVASATAAGGFASIGPIATATTAEIQVNGLPLYTTAAAGPPGTFASLFYVDSTAVTGGTWLWDFVTAAYVRIAGVF